MFRRFGTFFITINILFAVIVAQIGFWMHDTVAGLVAPRTTHIICSAAEESTVKLERLSESGLAQFRVLPGTQVRVDLRAGVDRTPAGLIIQLAAIPVSLIAFFGAFLFWLYFNRIFIYHSESWAGETAAYFLCFVCLVGVTILSETLSFVSIFAVLITVFLMLALNNLATLRELNRTEHLGDAFKKTVEKFHRSAWRYTVVAFVLCGLSLLVAQTGQRPGVFDAEGELNAFATYGSALALSVVIAIGFVLWIRRAHIPVMRQVELAMLQRAEEHPKEFSDHE